MELKIGDKIDVDTTCGKYVATVEKFDYGGNAAVAYTDKRKRFVLKKEYKDPDNLDGYNDDYIRTRVRYKLHKRVGVCYGFERI